MGYLTDSEIDDESDESTDDATHYIIDLPEGLSDSDESSDDDDSLESFEGESQVGLGNESDIEKNGEELSNELPSEADDVFEPAIEQTSLEYSESLEQQTSDVKDPSQKSEESQTGDIDAQIRALEKDFEKFKVENDEFESHMRRNMIMLQQVARETLRKHRISDADGNELEHVVRVTEQKCDALFTAVQKTRKTSKKMSKRLQKIKMSIIENPKLTEENKILYDSSKSKVSQKQLVTKEMIAKLREEAEQTHVANLERIGNFDFDRTQMEKVERELMAKISGSSSHGC